MVEIKTERTFEIREGKAVAIKTDSWVNGAGKNMKQIVEEQDITIEEANKVLEEYASEEQEKTFKQYEELQKKQQELYDEVSQIENTQEFKEFQDFLDKPSTKDNFDNLNKLKTYKQITGQIKEIEQKMSDIEKWRSQMEGIVEALNGSKE